jgi:hypothetical protein
VATWTRRWLPSPTKQGATLRIYPRPGHAARRLVLRDDHDDRGTHYHRDATL